MARPVVPERRALTAGAGFAAVVDGIPAPVRAAGGDPTPIDVAI